MTDHTTNGGFEERQKRTSPKGEFYTYFAIIFLFALPLALLAWALAFLKRGTSNNRSPIARAWSQARIITPMIFSA